MTTLDDNVAALLAEPAERGVHAQVLDRLMEETPDARRAALDLVLRRRDSDGPRHVYALWCDLNGEPKRAEFIRVQCEIAELEKRRGRLSPESISERVRLVGRLSILQRREAGLMSLHRSPSYGATERAWRGKAAFWATQLRPFWNRGFIEGVELRGRDWESHHEAILAEHPVERVVLTGVWPTMTAADGQCSPPCLVQYRVAGQDVEVYEEDFLLARDPDPVVTARNIAKLVCEKRWLGVTFTLPAAPPEYSTSLADAWETLTPPAAP